jgi:hypothetical protein
MIMIYIWQVRCITDQWAKMSGAYLHSFVTKSALFLEVTYW